MKHIKGPWTMLNEESKHGGINGVIRAANGVICLFEYPLYPENTRPDALAANAALISAAPDMLIALQELLDDMVVQDEFNTVAVNKAIKAISKATDSEYL